MGCDIHLHTEIKIGEQWHCYASPDIGRWYELFSKMAGVRNGSGITPISEPKGLPKDPSVVVKLSYDEGGSDAHTVSWFNVEEIKQLEEWMWVQYKEMKGYHYPEEEWGYYFGNSYGGFYKETSGALSVIEDVRFVFWFDN